MESRYLECFLGVVEEGSIAQAARRLDLAPATVAQRLKALESDVGCRLLQRSGRVVIPTVAGNRILHHARNVLAAERELRQAATNDELPPGPLRLGATPTALTGILPEVLQEWRRQYPDIPVHVDPAATPLLHARLMTGELDIVVMAHPNHSLPKTCKWQALTQEPLVMITPRALRVHDIRETLASEDFILYDRKTVAGKMVDSYLKRLQVTPKACLELDGIVPITELVAAALGIAVVPASPVLRRHEGSITVWPLPEPCPYRTLGALWLRSSPRLRIAEAFLDKLRKANLSPVSHQ